MTIRTMLYPIHLKKLNRMGIERQYLTCNLIVAKEQVKPRIPINKRHLQTMYFIRWISNILAFDYSTAHYSEVLEFTNKGYLLAEHISDDLKLIFPEAFNKT